VVLIGAWLWGHYGGHDPSTAAPQQARASVDQPRGSTAAQSCVTQDSPSPSPVSATASASRSPAETARLLQTLHQQRDYAAIAPLIVAERRNAMLDLLMSIDDVLSANSELQEAVHGAFGVAVAGLWDLSPMENNLGPFSAQVSIINQSFKGDTATVTLQEGENVPLARVQFDWTGTCWQYHPEATPAQLLPELERLACILREVAESTRHGTSFDACFDAFTQRVFPQMHRIVTAGDDRPQAVAAGGPTDGAD